MCSISLGGVTFESFTVMLGTDECDLGDNGAEVFLLDLGESGVGSSAGLGFGEVEVIRICLGDTRSAGLIGLSGDSVLCVGEAARALGERAVG